MICHVTYSTEVSCVFEDTESGKESTQGLHHGQIATRQGTVLNGLSECFQGDVVAVSLQ